MKDSSFLTKTREKTTYRHHRGPVESTRENLRSHRQSHSLPGRDPTLGSDCYQRSQFQVPLGVVVVVLVVVGGRGGLVPRRQKVAPSGVDFVV